MRLSLIFFGWLFLAVWSGAANDRWGDPSGFLRDGRVTVTEMHPAVTAFSANGRFDGRPLRLHVIAADLTHPEVTLQALTGERFVNLEGGQRFRRSTTSQLTEDSGALAAINVAFFDIRATQAPQGLLVRDGLLLREPTRGRVAFGLTGDDRAALFEAGWRGYVRVDGRRRDLAAINSPDLPDDSVGLYLLPWAQSPSSSTVFASERRVVEALVEQMSFEPASSASGHARIAGRVREVRENGSGFAIGEDQFVLTAYGNAGGVLASASRGAGVEVGWQLTDVPSEIRWHEIREAVAGGDALIRNGNKHPHDTNVCHPRSAGGIDRSGRKVALVLVDGRSAESAGISLAHLRDLLAHIGAHDAVNFDGGGSSAITAKLDGDIRVLNTPSDGRERFVPTGLGIVTTREGVSLFEPRTWTGSTGKEMHGVFHEFDAETEMVTMTLNGRHFRFPLSSLSESDQALILNHANRAPAR